MSGARCLTCGQRPLLATRSNKLVEFTLSDELRHVARDGGGVQVKESPVLVLVLVWIPSRTERGAGRGPAASPSRSEEHTSELQSLMRISYAVFCLKKKKTSTHRQYTQTHSQQKHRSKTATHNNILIQQT